MAATSDEPPDAASDQPAGGDQASESHPPSCAACTHLQKAQDQDQNQDQDRYLIDVQWDLGDAFESLTSSEADLRAESHEALRRTLRIWLRHRANGTHALRPAPDFLLYLLQYGYTKDDLALDQLEPQDLATVRCLRDVSAGLGLKVLLVQWTMTDDVILKADYEHHFEMVQDVPPGTSKKWHPFHNIIRSRVKVEQLVDIDDGELELKYLGGRIKDRSCLGQRCIQRDGDIFYVNHFRKWETGLSTQPGYFDDSPPIDPGRATAKQHYQSCAVLLVPESDFDCFLWAEIPFDRARHKMYDCVEQCTIPETRSRAIKTLRHLVAAVFDNNESHSRDDEYLRTEIMKIALDNLDYGLFNTILGHPSYPTMSFSEDVFQAVRAAIAKNPQMKFAEISDKLLAFLKFMCSEEEESLSKLERSVKLLWVLAPTGDGVPLRPDVLSWILEEAVPLVFLIYRPPYGSLTKRVAGPEGQAIVDLVVRYYPRVSITRHLNGILAPHIHNQSLMFGALAQMDRYADEGAYDREEGRALYHKLAKSTIQDMPSFFFKGARKDRETTALLDAKHVASLLNNCLKYQWEDVSDTLFAIMLKQFVDDKELSDTGIRLSDMQEYLIPGFLFTLLPLLPDCETESSPRLGTTVQRSMTQTLVYSILRKYLRQLLHEHSPLDTGPDYWRHPVSCANNCKLCTELNSFLQSQQQAKGFSYNTGRHTSHMTTQISSCEQCKFVAEPLRQPLRGDQNIFVVTKTAQTFEQQKATWQARSAMSSEFVAKLTEEPIQTRLDVLFFGEGGSITPHLDWRSVLETQEESAKIWQRLDCLDRPLDPLVPEHGSNFPPSLAGSKRKAEDQGGREISG